MTIEFTVDHDHTYAAEGGFEQLIGWITFSVGTYPGDFRVRDLGAGMPRTINLPSRRGWLAADGHLYQDQTLAAPCRLVANDPAFNLRHLTYRADFALTTVAGDPIAVPHTFFPAPSTDTTLPLTKVMTDPYQPVMEVRSKIYAEDILDAGDFGQDVVFAGTAVEFWDLAGTVPSTSLPSYVDDVLEFTNLAAFPATGETGKIYVDKAANESYRWSGSTYIRISEHVTAAGITDSTALGRELVKASSQAVARLALGPGVFDARDYGVNKNGSGVASNNVANLLDCLAAWAAYGSGTVVMPAGVIDTSDAVLGTVTADSGNIYTNTGSLPIFAGIPGMIQGQGRGATVIKLSKGLQKAFEFRYVNFVNTTFEDLTLQDFTVDRNNLLGVDIATGTLSSTISVSGWTNAPGLSAATFAYALAAFANGSQYKVRINSGVVQLSGSGTLTSGTTVSASLRGAVIVGTQYGTQYVDDPFYQSFKNITVKNVSAVNIAESSAASLAYIAANRSLGVHIYLQRHPSIEKDTPVADGILCENVTIDGGSFGVVVEGNSRTFIDKVYFAGCYHDTKISPTTNWNSANFLVGTSSWVNRVKVTDCVGKNSGDVALEVDQPWELLQSGNRWENSVNGIYALTIVPPARTLSGPPTATLQSGINTLLNSCTVNTALPDGIDESGWLIIDSEVMWYQVTSSTELTIWRGGNGTSAASHSSSAKVTFIETEKTSVVSVNETIVNDTVMAYSTLGLANTGGSSPFYLPLPPLTIRDMTITETGGLNKSGEAITFTGYRSKLDIDGLYFTHSNISGTNAGDRGAIIYSWPAGYSMYSGGVPIRVPNIKGRNIYIKANGTLTGSNHGYCGFIASNAWSKIDLEMVVDLQFRGGRVRGIRLNPDTSTMVYAAGSRFGLKFRCPVVGATQPVGLLIEDDSNLVIEKLIDVDLDVAEMAFTASAGDGNYRPWQIDSDLVGQIRFGKVRHSTAATRKYPTSKQMAVKINAASYTATADDDIILVDTTSNAVTITVPAAAGGYSAVGEPLSRGNRIIVVDAGRYAATNPITIVPTGSDTIDGASAVSITGNGGQVSLLAVAELPGWISSQPADNLDGTATM